MWSEKVANAKHFPRLAKLAVTEFGRNHRGFSTGLFSLMKFFLERASQAGLLETLFRTDRIAELAMNRFAFPRQTFGVPYVLCKQALAIGGEIFLYARRAHLFRTDMKNALFHGTIALRFLAMTEIAGPAWP